MAITKEMIHAAFDQGLAVYRGEKSFSKADASLASQYNFNLSSAKDYTRNLTRLLNGQIFQRTLSVEGTRIYLQRIFDEMGVEFLEQAISSIEQHLDYYEDLKKVNMTGQRGLIKDFKQLLVGYSALTPITIIDTALQIEVSKAMQDDDAQRRARLANASAIPKQIHVVAKAYLRNADVIAEVLKKADGSCQSCKKLAPFVRRSTGTPYLEVHHRLPLSEGGEDTVENAVALCPNCHREAHFGVK